ncbi:protein-arginine deiminase domain-containing protein [Allokutzneria sp. A3M-2-11 16]|uniref:protein-arginine deiminase domain-containing protein n=1 Tax=Allokutzneria sp. A3M-2-11 16 TaxID=2962043 RepID=UPI0020B6E665|nr:protein-arginine deiminase domain-containing protein [Allokutzneria sp. A3M-2-11 16]MCP3798414.1 protein-arginine deiminase domain-containing protein [Allokutzneria sp. A3M-2-11 16]
MSVKWVNAAWALVLGVSAVAAVSPSALADPRDAKVRLVADTNRDGKVDADADEAGKQLWREGRGAIFLPNLDDDGKRCTVSEADLKNPDIAVDTRIAACHDAQDEELNGPNDIADLAPLWTIPKPELSAGTTGTVSLAPQQEKYARLWINRGGAWAPLTGKLTEQELRAGAQLALEGLDVVRDRAVWDGVVTVTLVVGNSRDSVQLKVAPIILQTDLKPAQRVLTSDTPDAMPGYTEFVRDLRTAVERSGLPASELSIWSHRDRWFQDFVEPATVSAPGPNGPQVMRILLRSSNYRVYPGHPSHTLRPVGRLLFTHLRGPGIGVVQQFTADRADTVADTLNSTGNFDSIPPDARNPLGRPFFGSAASRHPDPSFTKMLSSQHAQPVVVDTSWLLVGHVDETTHVIPATTARGWTMMVADPRLAVNRLKDAQRAGHGAARLFDNTVEPVKPTIDESLANPAFLTVNETAARHIDAQIDVLTRETGLKATELVRVPVLFKEYDPEAAADAPETKRMVESGKLTVQDLEGLRKLARTGRAPAKFLVASTASIVNGLSIKAGVFAAPKPHGPVVNGVDLFERATEDALAGYPVRLSWVEDWAYLHMLIGEVHCGTNALREPTRADWWRALR